MVKNIGYLSKEFIRTRQGVYVLLAKIQGNLKKVAIIY